MAHWRPRSVALFLFATVALVWCAPGQSPYILVEKGGGSIFPWGSFPDMTEWAPNYTNPAHPTFKWTFTGNIGHITAGILGAAASVNDSLLVTWGRCCVTGRGNSAQSSHCAPKVVANFSPAKIISMSSGDFPSVLLLDNGTAYTWGYAPSHAATYSFLGRSTTATSRYLVGKVDTSEVKKHLDADETIVKVQSSSYTATMLSSKGKAFSFGLNNFKGLGQTSPGARDDYSLIPYPLQLSRVPAGRKIVDISVGYNHLLLLDDGTYMCYGWIRGGCNGDRNAFGELPIPVHFRGPKRFKKLLVAHLSSFGWDMDDNIWVWGRADFVPTGRSRGCTLPRGTCTPRRLEPIEGSGKIVDLFHIDIISVYALTERRHLYVIECALDGYGPCEANRTWERVDYTLPPGYALDLNRAHVSWDVFFATARAIPPEHMCYGPPPFESPDYTCIDGVWTLFSSLTINASQPIIVEGATGIRGDFLVLANSSITVEMGGHSTAISVQDCFRIDSGSSITVDLTDEYLELLGNSKTATIGLVEYDAKCEPPNLDNVVLKLNNKAKKSASCKRYTVSSTQLGTKGSKGTLTMLIRIDSSRCRLWWIITVSVVGGVLIIVAVIVVILLGVKSTRKNRKLRMKADAQ